MEELSPAVTATVMVLLPKLKARELEALPEVTVTLLTLTVAELLATVGVTVMLLEVVVAVYVVVPEAKVGLKVPVEITKADRVASVLKRVMVRV